jgi:hypothetical protein
MNLNDWRASVSPQGPALVRSDGCSSSHPLWRGGAKLIITMTTDRSALLQRSPDTMECCIAPTPPPGLPFRVKGGQGSDPLGTSLVPQLAAEVVALARFSALCQNLTHAVQQNPVQRPRFHFLRSEELRLARDFATSRAQAIKRSTTGLKVRFFNVRTPASASATPGRAPYRCAAASDPVPVQGCHRGSA